MPICRFFLNDSCRYGVYCKFDHIYDDQHRNNGYNEPQTKQRDGDGISIMRRINQNSTKSSEHYFSRPAQNQVSTYTVENTPHYNTYDPSRYTYHNPNAFKKHPENLKSKQDPKELLQVAVEDMLVLENGKQWPLTCYAITSSSGNIPGWEDYSPEELRWETVIALKNGTFEGMKLKIKTLYDSAEILRNIFKTADASAYELIKKSINLKLETSSCPIQSQQPVNSFFVNNVNSTDVKTNFTFTLAPANENSLFRQPPSEELSQNPLVSNKEFLKTPSPVVLHDKHVAEMEYSSKQTLTHREVKAYEANTFTYGSIPTKPPPREFCNNYPR